ncbi:uncharacterized protein [Littorina saxatilis]|uniref:uncharacterized protein n=1 Tax=Littorina saxatilis TaxID=31220 RepID=UPI0038B48E42
MLHIANHGCGLPKLELASCDGFHACANAMAANISVPQGYFLDICSTISTFQLCAGDMMASCSLEDHVLPSLHQLSVITRRTCTAIKHQRSENCTEFMQCLSNTRVPPPLDGASLSSFQWCNLTLAILQCAKTYSSECNFTSSGRVTLLDIYTDALSQGCTNVYSLRVTTSENGADNVRGWFTLLFATLVCVWAFLDTHEGLYI